ncbi:MAG: hypothetical protein ACRDKE_01130, partial [Solirubrobacterales bacterium]
KATVTLTNANGSTSASAVSDVIEPDSDGDGVTDPEDSCPAESGSRPNGCEPSEIVANGVPTISGSTVVGQQLAATTGLWNVLHDPLGLTYTYQWQRCTSASGGSCSTPFATASNTYTLGTIDALKVLRVLVTATNDDDSETQASAFSTTITAAPVTPPDGGGTTPPPPAPPTNPLTLTVKKTLGNLTPKKGVVTIKGAVVACAASATGPCKGKITFNVKKGGTSAKYIDYPILIAPGRTSAVIVKLKSAKLKAIAKAKSVKTTVKISVAAPGFAPSTATATATLKPQKKK